MATARMAICLFQDTITDFNRNELIVGSSLVEVPLISQTSVETALYLRSANPSTPEWVDIVSSFGSIDGQDLRTSSSGAILFLKVNNRILGCCFGTSVANIEKDNIETDFGLGVAYDKMSPNQTKSIQSWAPTDNPITSSRSATLPMNRLNFNIDQFIESITELAGFQSRNQRRILIKGKEFFSISAPRALVDIVELCESCLDSYLRAAEDQNFKALTSIRRIKDVRKIEELDEQLFSAIRNRSPNLYLVDYESFDNCDGYKLSENAEKISEITPDVVLSRFNPHSNLNINILKARKIYALDHNDELLATWPLYKCIFYSNPASSSVLFKGRWYDVDINYIRSLESFIDQHQSSDISFPRWNGIDDEATFNLAASHSIGGQCWDERLYRTPENRHGIEFCDILLNNNIIHVKRKPRSSQSSHLLLQAAVSAQLLSTDPQIKTWIVNTMGAEFPDRHLLNEDLSFASPEPVTYYIVLMTQRVGSIGQSLPFFSLISFNMMIKRILALGYVVKVSQV